MAQSEHRGADCYEEQSTPKWLVMIYLAGDNNLSANCIAILQELEAAHYSDDVRVVACFDTNTPRPRGARYVEIGRHRKHPNANINWGLHNDLVPFECLPGHPVEAPDFCCDDNDPGHAPSTTEPVAMEGLSRFLKFALEHYRARKHMLILFGHGSAVAGNMFLADDTPPSFLRLGELRIVLARHFEARPNPRDPVEHDPADDDPGNFESEEDKEKKKPPLDILACDNCMMNGIESAYEIRRRVRYIIGSQGLMLALGWPFRKIINEVIHNQDKQPQDVAKAILKVCARNLLDFSMMDRSSEQSLCDVTTLLKGGDEGDKRNLVSAIRDLSRAMQDGLAVDECGTVLNPALRDAIRLARLEAQSYWSETFVDLYDFCMLLLNRCNDFKTLLVVIKNDLQIADAAREAEGSRRDKAAGKPLSERFLDPFKGIADACNEVLNMLKTDFVLSSYYIGPDSQYSNGVSIYFPWTLPEAPIIFEPEPYSGGGGTYSVSWTSFNRIQKLAERRMRAELTGQSVEEPPPTDFKLVTAFDEYKNYEFATREGGDWAAFLKAFFRATLRDVRRFEVKYDKPSEHKEETLFFEPVAQPERFEPPPVNLQKSSSDVDSETDCQCPTIKNYPRRFYISPADCLRKCPDAGGGTVGCTTPPGSEDCPEVSGDDPRLCVSYLGWNVRGIVADVIHLPHQPHSEAGRASEAESEKI